MSKQIRITTVAIAALVIGAAFIVGALFGINGSSSTLNADESSQTWHVVDMGSWRMEGEVFDGKPFTGRALVEQLPAECSFLVSPHSESIFYYSCPMEWTPVPDKTQ